MSDYDAGYFKEIQRNDLPTKNCPGIGGTYL